ncbi:MAG TPA: hypothetical protein VF623_15020 [Segetibacter sp.]|jgi:hypothetical protein
MKKYFLSAVIFCGTLNMPCVAQQTLNSSPLSKRDSLLELEEQLVNNRSIDPSKLTEKEVSQEINVGKADIFLDVKYRNVEIKTWNQPKVKLITKVLVEGKSTLTDEQWFEKLNLIVKVIGSRVQITSGVISTSYFNGYSSVSTLNIGGNASTNSRLAVFNGDGNRIGAIETAKRTIVLFVPEGNKIEIENQSGNLQLGNLQTVNIKSNNGSIEAGDINRLYLRSKYTPVVIGNVKDAEIEMSNGRLKAGNIDKLDIDSKYATVEIASTINATIRSANDEYEIENAGDIRGRKTYGNLRITNLITAIDFEGANADIKVKNISPTVETININNKYADIRLPVNSLKNYEVTFTGGYNTVYAPFEKKAVMDTTIKNRYSGATDTGSMAAQNRSIAAQNRAIAAQNRSIDTQSRSIAAQGLSATATGYSSSYSGTGSVLILTGTSNSGGFTGQVGDIKGKHTKFVINCASCTVDFK